MILNVLRSDFLKIKKATWLIAVLGPLGVVLMQVFNYAIRYDYLMSQREDKWKFFIENVHSYWPPALILGITLITSLLVSVEHQTNSWKTLMSLPVRPRYVYQSKVIVIVIMLTLSSILLFAGTYLLGEALSLGSGFPFSYALMMSFYTLFAVLPFLFFQFWLSVKYFNQGIALTVGIASAVFTMYAYGLPDWVPWKWPLLANGIMEGLQFSGYGIGLGALLGILILMVLARRDVN